MASDFDWGAWGKEIGEEFIDALKPVLGEVWDQAKDDLTPLGKRAAKYWMLVQKGDEDAQVALESVQRQVALIVARHLRDVESSTRIAFLKAVDVALIVVGRILSIALK